VKRQRLEPSCVPSAPGVLFGLGPLAVWRTPPIAPLHSVARLLDIIWHRRGAEDRPHCNLTNWLGTLDGETTTHHSQRPIESAGRTHRQNYLLQCWRGVRAQVIPRIFVGPGDLTTGPGHRGRSGDEGGQRLFARPEVNITDLVCRSRKVWPYQTFDEVAARHQGAGTGRRRGGLRGLRRAGL
jgi:hypothetical protein